MGVAQTQTRALHSHYTLGRPLPRRVPTLRCGLRQSCEKERTHEDVEHGSTRKQTRQRTEAVAHHSNQGVHAAKHEAAVTTSALSSRQGSEAGNTHAQQCTAVKGDDSLRRLTRRAQELLDPDKVMQEEVCLDPTVGGCEKLCRDGAGRRDVSVSPKTVVGFLASRQSGGRRTSSREYLHAVERKADDEKRHSCVCTQSSLWKALNISKAVTSQVYMCVERSRF